MLVRHGSADGWHEPGVAGYPSEQDLEMLLAQSPDLLPWEFGQDLVLASQVYFPPAGTADLIGVSPQGDIILVECKLQSNAEIRRHIVGQVFAYASALWGMAYDAFVEAFAGPQGRNLVDAARSATEGAGSSWDEEAFRDAVSTNLKEGRFRLLVAVDVITDERQRIVEYINQHTVPQVQLLALQLQYRRDGDVEILLPTIYGQETVQNKTISTAAQTTEEQLLSALKDACSADGFEAVRRLYEWSAENGMTPYWGRGHNPSLTAWFEVDNVSIAPWSIWVTARDPSVSVNFEYMRNRGLPMERIDDFLSTLEQIPGMASRLAGVRPADFKKRPGIRIDPILAKPGTVDAFGRALAHLLGKEWSGT